MVGMVYEDLKMYPGNEKKKPKESLWKDNRKTPLSYPWQIFYEQGSEF